MECTTCNNKEMMEMNDDRGVDYWCGHCGAFKYVNESGVARDHVPKLITMLRAAVNGSQQPEGMKDFQLKAKE